MSIDITSLVDQAGLNYVMTADKPFIEDDLRKFAELIVKECASIALRTQMECCVDILHHFGLSYETD